MSFINVFFVLTLKIIVCMVFLQVVLRGSSLEKLKKLKSVIQYAIFAAYHLSLETSFLADEGAILPKSPHFTPEKRILDNDREEFDLLQRIKSTDFNLVRGLQESLSELEAVDTDDDIYRKSLTDACDENLALDGALDSRSCSQVESPSQVESQSIDDAEASSEYFSANDTSQSILVSFSSHCILNGSVCARSRLLRVKFYGPSDKPLGRYLREDLFDEVPYFRFILLFLLLFLSLSLSLAN